MSPSHWEVTEVDGINVLNPLPVLGRACGQVQFGESGYASNGRVGRPILGPISVGTALLAMRYGKQGAGRLDNLSQPRPHPSAAHHEPTAWLGPVPAPEVGPAS